VTLLHEVRKRLLSRSVGIGVASAALLAVAGSNSEQPSRAQPGACHPVYAQDLLPTFEVTMAPEAWAALQADQALRSEREERREDAKPYHHVELFRWEEISTTTAMIRLKGETSWYGPKLQFVISFNEREQGGRFLGLRKITLDATPLIDRSLLRDRLALAILRDLGLAAPCANHARLVVNGVYYGLYANIERVDREFLERNFGKRDADGNLYESGWEIKTNKGREDRTRLRALWAATDVAGLAAVADLEQAVLMWAAEAVIPQADGYSVGRGNYYIYDHPERGFAWIPWDLDKTFDFSDVSLDPIGFKAHNRNKPPQLAIVLADPAWRTRYVDAVARALAAYDPAVQLGRIDSWAAQIRTAIADDPNLGYTATRHRRAVATLRAYIQARHTFLNGWLACQRTTADHGWCRRCEDATCNVR
jgi:hypothetical protein